jgi:hypothetical protein
MSIEMTNLLSPNRIRAFRRRYFARLLVLAITMLIFLTGAHALMLVPTHELLTAQIDQHKSALERIASANDRATEAEFTKKLALLTKGATRVQALSKSRSSVGTLETILAVPRGRITLSNLSFTAGGEKKPPTLSLVGVAATRDDLRQYQIALQSTAVVAIAELPVSLYAKETDIAFTITVTLTTL